MPDTAHSVKPPSSKGYFLGFDYGLKRIGIACGQNHTGSATPLCTIPVTNSRPDWNKIDELYSRWQPQAMVVGIPEYATNPQQAMVVAARAFAKRLRKRYQIPVHTQDESHSSIEASGIIANNRNKHNRRRTRSGDLDKLAAALILENWLNDHTQ